MRVILVTCTLVQIIGISPNLPAITIAPADAEPTAVLSSPDFKNGDTIPLRYTCSGDNKSPALKWASIPGGARSLALIADDPDAPMGTFVHWVLYNIPPSTNGLPEGVSTSASVTNAEQGVNGRGSVGYTGPCPPPGKPHHYHFRLYALDQKMDLRPGATAEQVQAAMNGHVLAKTELVGVFER
jgi:Raf kinase inhibitor-like YbhB/YbcL family protein